MPNFDRRALGQQAADKLSAAHNRGKLVLLFAGVSAGLSLASCIISIILDSQIAGTGGLGGMQLRSVLSTLQTLLELALFVFIPFWNLGYLSVALKLGRGEPADQKNLLDGFRRFGPALRLMLLRTVVSVIIGFVAMQVASILFAMTPWAEPFYRQVEDLNLLDISGGWDEAALKALLPAMIVYWAIIAALYVIAMIPVTYRLRMSEYRIMDEPRCGALMAMFQSNRMMKGNCVALFKLDLSFWWYYLATVLVALLCYGDILLAMAGIALPFSGEVGYFLFYVLALGAQILLYWRCRNQVECTYVCAYDALSVEPVQPAQPPQNVPWNYQ